MPLLRRPIFQCGAIPVGVRMAPWVCSISKEFPVFRCKWRCYSCPVRAGIASRGIETIQGGVPLGYGELENFQLIPHLRVLNRIREFGHDGGLGHAVVVIIRQLWLSGFASARGDQNDAVGGPRSVNGGRSVL